MKTVELTMAQALVSYLAALQIETEDSQIVPYCNGVFAIFGHGNVAALGEALWQTRQKLPVYRAHNEQAMAHAAIAYAKAHNRQRIMACTTSIGPGATNLLTAAALAHVNRLPVLLLPGDTFANRAPDPVLQQLESFSDGTVSVNDAFRPLTRYFDRITHPENILSALPRALSIMTDSALCGPVCLSLPQDVQAESFACPIEFLTPPTLRIRTPQVQTKELVEVCELLRSAKRPFVIAGGGVLYSHASKHLIQFLDTFGIPAGETQAGKGSLPWNHSLNMGAVGVTGSPAANAMAETADVVLVIGSRLSDFTTGSHTLFAQAKCICLNVQPLDGIKLYAQPFIADAKLGLESLQKVLGSWHADGEWTSQAQAAAAQWRDRVSLLTSAIPEKTLPYDAEVIGAVQNSSKDSCTTDVVVCAAGTLPAELHKLWRTSRPGNYHVEYGFSCMGYEIAAGIGVKMARPECEVIVMVGDGSYLMMNSEIATSVLLGTKIIIVVLDNSGYGCIQRLQTASGSEKYNNMLADCVASNGSLPTIHFAEHAKSLGALSAHANTLQEFQECMVLARQATRTYVVVVNTTYTRVTADGGCWWDVSIPQVSSRVQVQEARKNYVIHKEAQKLS